MAVRSRLSLIVTLAIALPALFSQGCGEGQNDLTNRDAGFFGINGNLVFNLVIADQMALVDRHLEGIANLGVTFVRSQADWRRVEQEHPVGRAGRDFTITDAWVERLSAHGLRWQVVGNGRPTPRWAADEADYLACGSRAAPADADHFPRYMAALARRYGHEGSFWREHPDLPELPPIAYEVWNEPNHGAFWCPQPDPEAYATLLAKTANAIRRVDPSATILFGGLAAFESAAPSDGPLGRLSYREFLIRALQSAPARAVDGVAVHPYGATPAVVGAQLEGFRSAINAAGLASVPLYVNEAGWYTNGIGGRPPTPEATRSEYIGEFAATVWSARERLNIASFAPYSWTTREQDPADPQDWFGLADPASARPYPSALAYGAAVRDRDNRLP